MGLRPFHFQRPFKRWAGVSPKQFAGFLTVESAKAALERSQSLLSATRDAGLSGMSRLHDLFVTVEAMTPGDYKAQGRDIVISYGFHDTPFGRALVLATDRGICGLEFLANGDKAAVLAHAKDRWPLNRFAAWPDMTGAAIAGAFAPPRTKSGQKMRLLLKGTNFQIQVWPALLRIPPGAIVSYGDIARDVCSAAASRAVGTALGQNAIGYLVPRHRVWRATGLFKNYRWGAARRHAMLAWDAAHAGP